MNSKSISRWVLVLAASVSVPLFDLVPRPAHAAVPPNGEYSCATGTTAGPDPKYTVDGGEVGAFSGTDCTGAVVVPEGVTGIGIYAFSSPTSSTSSLTSVTIPSTVTTIGNYAFYKAGLTSLTIPSTVTSIGNSAFANNVNLQTLSFASGNTPISIPQNAFIYASSLVSVTFPDNLTSIGMSAFYEAIALTSVTFPNSLTSIGNTAFYKATSLASVTFPNSLTSIGDSAFGENASLASVTLPNSLTSLGSTAFMSSPNLANIFFLGDAPTMGANVFVHVSVSAKIWHRADATGFTPSGDPPTWNGLPVGVGVHSIAYDNQYATTPQVGGSTYYLRGSKIPTIPTSPPAKSQHTFLGWFTASNGGVEVTSNSYAPASPYGNVTLYARWDPFVYDVVYDSAGGSALEEGSFAVGGSIASAPVSPTRSGFTFVGWSATDGGDVVTFPYFPGVTTDIILFAKWSVNSYVVDYDSNGGSSLAQGSFVTGGVIGSAPVSPTRSGFTFVGWSATDGGDVVTFPYRPGVTTDITLFAKWSQDLSRATATVKPRVTGAARVSKTVTANQGMWTGVPNPTFTYQWYACSRSVSKPRSTVPGGCKAIAGARKSTLKLSKKHKSQFISVLVTGVSSGAPETSWMTASTGKVR